MNKKIFIIFTLLMMCFSIAYSTNESDLLVRYGMESGGGALLLDDSINNLSLIKYSNMYWNDTVNQWGNYSIYGDSTGYFYKTGIAGGLFGSDIGMTFWVHEKDSVSSSPSTYVMYQDDVYQHVAFGVLYSPTASGGYDANSTYFIYRGTDFAVHAEKIYDEQLDPLATNFTHFVVNIDLDTSLLEVYVDSVLEYNSTLSPNLLLPTFYYTGTDRLFVGTYNGGIGLYKLRGFMDELRIYNSSITGDQASNLYECNTLDACAGSPSTPPEEIQETYIITSTSPSDGDTVYNLVEIEATTAHKADCSLYINNQFVESFNDVTAFSSSYNLEEETNHTYFIYCEYMIDDTLYYEISDIHTFYVDQYDPNLVTFKIIPEDFEIGDYELWITSPCLDRGAGIEIGENLPYEPKYNPNGAYFAQIDSEGFASMNLSPDTHEFCLFSGKLIVNEANKTTNYDVVSVNNNLDLGKIDVPNNISSYFEIIVDKFSILPKYNPEAWGETWASVIGGLVLLFLGAVTLMVGMASNNGKITIGGVLLLLSGMGISFGGLLGVLI